MKRIVLVLFVIILVVSTFSVHAESIHYIPYTVGSISFLVPDTFKDIGGENETIFELPDGSQIRFDMIQASGSLEASVHEFDDSLPFIGVSYTIETNAQGLPYADCSFSSILLSTYGRAALFLDTDAEIIYSFVLASNHDFTDDEISTWRLIVGSVSEPNIARQNRPTPSPSPTPTPAPDIIATVAPATFDFNAINRNPDKYQGVHFTITGYVLQIIESEEQPGTLVRARIATRGRYDDVIYVGYYRQPGEDRIIEGDLLTFNAVGRGLYTYDTVENVSKTLPLFMLEEVVSIR